MGLKPKQVRWIKRNTKESKFLSLLKAKSSKVLDYMEKEREEEWFKNVQQYRNMAAHQHYVPTNALIMGYAEPQMDIFYWDDNGNMQRAEISKCRTYLKSMVEHIQQVWEMMTPEFE